MALFGKNKKEKKAMIPPAEVDQKETTYFGKNLQIKGRVTGNGNLIILGTLEGEFNLKGKLKIAQPASIKGDVKADTISVNGNVQGNVTALEKIHLDQTARIKGQISTPKISIVEGAFFDGEIKMSDRAQNSTASYATVSGSSAPITSPASTKK